MTLDPTRAVWRKSTRSNGSGDCVEVAELGAVVGVRDSKNPTGGVLTFDRAAFAAFVDGVRDGQFDLT